jgi:hypothetical protein
MPTLHAGGGGGGLAFHLLHVKLAFGVGLAGTLLGDGLAAGHRIKILMALTTIPFVITSPRTSVYVDRYP